MLRRRGSATRFWQAYDRTSATWPSAQRGTARARSEPGGDGSDEVHPGGARRRQAADLTDSAGQGRDLRFLGHLVRAVPRAASAVRRSEEAVSRARMTWCFCPSTPTKITSRWRRFWTQQHWSASSVYFETGWCGCCTSAPFRRPSLRTRQGRIVSRMNGFNAGSIRGRYRGADSERPSLSRRAGRNKWASGA